MRKILHSFAATCVAVLVIVAAPNAARAVDPQRSDSTNRSIGKDPMLFAQEETSKPKKVAGQKGSKGPKLNVDRKGVILNGYDPVAYFKQGKAVKGKSSIASTYKGATYYFASKADKADFDKSPAKFAPKYGGFCANSMVKRELKDADPNVFFIYKDKLYVCSTPAAEKEFSNKPDVNIQKADKNWQFYEPPTNPGFNRELGS